MLVSFDDYRPVARYDGIPWSTIVIEESSAQDGPWTQIDSQDIVPLDTNPTDPMERSFTTDNATLVSGWYRVTFKDAENNVSIAAPVYNTPSVEIMANLNDINANLDGEVVEATSQNTALLQVSVARVITGFLSRVLDTTTLASWITPDVTPDIIREIAGMLIASQLYFNEMSRTSILMENTSYAQILYDRAMALLNGIIDGTVNVVDLPPGSSVDSVEGMSTLDFWPVDNTDRAFTMGQKF